MHHHISVAKFIFTLARAKFTCQTLLSTFPLILIFFQILKQAPSVLRSVLNTIKYFKLCQMLVLTMNLHYFCT